MSTRENDPRERGLPDPQVVQLARVETLPTADQCLWAIIKDRTEAVRFGAYKQFMDGVLLDMLGKTNRRRAAAGDRDTVERIVDRVDAYEVLKTATELFLMAECGLIPGELKLKELAEKKREPASRGQANAAGSKAAGGQQEAALATGSESLPSKSQDDDTSKLQEEYLQQLASSPQAKVLPYYAPIIKRLADLPAKSELVAKAAYDYGILYGAATSPPMIELIWSYWHEQGMLVQAMAAIAARFQNRRIGANDPLANLNIDPLRGASNLLWGWIQEERNRLTVGRRAYEYDHEYGLSVYGRAVPQIDAADTRSKFLRCFHELLGLCVKFYEADDDTTVIADPFPVLNGLKEVHMVLAEGAHNQFGDLPWTARVEMMVMQWVLARPELREFLGGRPMVPYEEEWMDRVDSMRQLQGWGDTSVSQFRDLAVFGERVLLSIRYGNWMTGSDMDQAANWAREWRKEVLVYIHAYRTVTGVDLAAEPVDAHAAQARFRQPADFLRLQEAQRARHLPAAAVRRD